MGLQIYCGKGFDTQKAERYFKERRVSYQRVDVLKYGIGKREIIDTLNDDALLAAAIIETAMLLHNSRYKGNASLDNVLALLGDMQEKDFYVQEFEGLISTLKASE